MSTANSGLPPAGPLQLGLREWVDVAKRTGKEFLDDDAIGLSSRIAYSSLLAFFPTMIFLIGLLDLIDAYDALRGFLEPISPEAVLDLINDVARNVGGSGSVLALVLGALGALWVASGAMGALIKSVNRAYDHSELRPFWKLRLVALVLVGLTGTTIVSVLALIVFGGPLGQAIADKARLGSVFEAFWAIARWPIAFTAILIFFALVYYIAPSGRPRGWRWITPGSLLGSVLWLALSGLFALYTSLSDRYNETYGSIAGGIVLLLWLNYSAMAILLGAELNSELDRQADIRAAGGTKAGLIRQAKRVNAPSSGRSP